MAQNSLAVIQVRLSIKKKKKLSVCPIVPHSNHQLSDGVLFFLLVIHLFNHSCILSYGYMFLHSFVLLFAVFVHCLQVSTTFVQNLLHYLRLGNKPFFASYCHLIVYAPDMPNRLPVKDFVGGLVTNILRALKYWLHYTLVALAWLGVVPITACKCKFIKHRTSRKSIEKNKGAEKYFSSVLVTRQCTSTNKLTISITK